MSREDFFGDIETAEQEIADEKCKPAKRYGMCRNTNMNYEVILSDTASAQAERILDYILYELENLQAMRRVERDYGEVITCGR